MTCPRYAIIAFLLIFSATLGVFAQDNVFDDSYCGKNFAFAQNNCPLRCASGTDQECVDILGEEYKCFAMTGCSGRIKNQRLREHPNSRRTVGEGVCASTLNSAILGCDTRVSCSGDMDCAMGESCYSDIGCGNPLVELNSEFLFIMIGVQSPLDEAAENTLTQTLSTFLAPILEETNVALDSVGIIDSQQSGVMLDVNVKFTGLYRPSMEQNLGQIVIDAFNGEAQTALSEPVIVQNTFISLLSSESSSFSGVVSALLTLQNYGFRPVPSPTPSPTATPPPTERTMYYLSVTVYNTPYQTLYMDDFDFEKFAEVLASILNRQIGNSITIKGVRLGYHKLISLGNYGLTATEIHLGYEVSTNLSASEVGDEVARAVGRSKKAMLSLLQDHSDMYPYFLEIDDIQAQSISSIGDSNGGAWLPSVIPEKPLLTQPAEKLSAEEGSNVQEAETGAFSGPLVGELLAIDSAKDQAATAAGNVKANTVIEPTTVKNDPGGLGAGALIGVVVALLICFMVVLGITYRQFEKKRILIVEQRRKMLEEDVEDDFESNKSGSERKLMVRKRSSSSTVDIESGEKSTSSSSSPDSTDVPLRGSPIRRISNTEKEKQNRMTERRSSLGRRQSSTKSSKSAGNESSIPRSKSMTRRRSSLGSHHSSTRSYSSADVSMGSALSDLEMATNNPILPWSRDDDDVPSVSSSESDSSSSSRSTTSHGTTSGTESRTTTEHSGTTSDTDDSGTTSGDDSSSDESEDCSRTAAATAVVRKKVTIQLSLDEQKSEEIKACMTDPSLSNDERKTKISEINSRYNSKKLEEESKSAGYQRHLEQFLVGDQPKQKSRRAAVSAVARKPRPGLGMRGASDKSFGSNAAMRRKPLTRTRSSQSLGGSDDKLNSSSRSLSSRRRSSVSVTSSSGSSTFARTRSSQSLGGSDDKLNSSSHSLTSRRRSSVSVASSAGSSTFARTRSSQSLGGSEDKLNSSSHSLTSRRRSSVSVASSAVSRAASVGSRASGASSGSVAASVGSRASFSSSGSRASGDRRDLYRRHNSMPPMHLKDPPEFANSPQRPRSSRHLSTA